MTLYNLSLEFWHSFKTAQNKLGAGVALANTEVFYLLANAGWQVARSDLLELIDWYEIMGLPPAVIVESSRDEQTEAQLKEAGFTLERAFAFRPAGEPITTPDTQVEQVSWSQMRYAGELLADFYEQPDNALSISKSLTKAMQLERNIQTYLAYQDTPTGVMVTFQTSAYLLAMLLVDKNGGLEQRLVQDAKHRNLKPLVLEALPAGTGVAAKGGLERWSIR